MRFGDMGAARLRDVFVETHSWVFYRASQVLQDLVRDRVALSFDRP